MIWNSAVSTLSAQPKMAELDQQSTFQIYSTIQLQITCDIKHPKSPIQNCGNDLLEICSTLTKTIYCCLCWYLTWLSIPAPFSCTLRCRPVWSTSGFGHEGSPAVRGSRQYTCLTIPLDLLNLSSRKISFRKLYIIKISIGPFFFSITKSKMMHLSNKLENFRNSNT